MRRGDSDADGDAGAVGETRMGIGQGLNREAQALTDPYRLRRVCTRRKTMNSSPP